MIALLLAMQMMVPGNYTIDRDGAASDCMKVDGSGRVTTVTPGPCEVKPAAACFDLGPTMGTKCCPAGSFMVEVYDKDAKRVVVQMPDGGSITAYTKPICMAPLTWSEPTPPHSEKQK